MNNDEKKTKTEKIEIPYDVKRYVRKKRSIRWAVFIILSLAFAAMFKYIPAFVSFSDFERNVVLGVGILLIIFVSGVPIKVIDTSWQGKIIDVFIKTTTGSRIIGQPKRGSWYTEASILLIVEKPNGHTVRRLAERGPLRDVKGNIEKYELGAYAVHVGGAEYTSVLKKNQSNFRCVICGMYSPPDKETCIECGHTLIKADY